MSVVTSSMRRRSRRSHSRSLLVFAVIAVLCCFVHVTTPARAKDCVSVGPGTMLAWKHEQGSFQCVNCFGATADAVNKGIVRRQWKEYDRERKLLNSFVEDIRDGMQLVLHDSSRDISILLRSDMCGIRTGNEQNFRQLYGGTFMTVVDCT